MGTPVRLERLDGFQRGGQRRHLGGVRLRRHARPLSVSPLQQQIRSPASSLFRTPPFSALESVGSWNATDLLQLLEGGPAYVQQFLPLLREPFELLFAFEKPLVAALNGHAIAGGCILACVSHGERRRTHRRPELRVGVPFPAVALEAVRLAVARVHLQSVRYDGLTYEPEQALTLGLLDEIVASEALLDDAIRAAEGLAAAPASAFALPKRQVRAPFLARIAAAREKLEPEIDAAMARSCDPRARAVLRGGDTAEAIGDLKERGPNP